ncbi:hypothetical protein TrVE_jg348 [Triparma verrucosa]|uniref:Uncharacterized protein n=1 Tax=Triparma verrucosa TaxID=1606542 RepID=A0A9W7F3L5_9STRA|nr:hypothetical protein TrVE_jg348 [Triparma verrucosa]
MNRSIAIVDCGSGYSRLAYYTVNPSTGLIETSRHPTNLPPLHKVISDLDSLKDWISSLLFLLPSPPPPLSIGATAGLRSILPSLPPSSLSSFRSLLPSPFTFFILKPNQEAKYELSSSKYCSLKTKLIKPEESFGMMSSGGQSSQLGYEDSLWSFETSVKSGNELGVKLGMKEGLRIFKEKVQNTMEGVEKGVGGEGGVFVVIEMLAASGSAAGLESNRRYKVGNVIEIIDVFLKNSGDKNVEGERSWKDYVKEMGAVVLLEMLGKLKEGSEVAFCREFELGEGNFVKPSWALGRAISEFIGEVEEEEGKSKEEERAQMNARKIVGLGAIVAVVAAIGIMYPRLRRSEKLN